jgi:hypothetical protein
LKGRCWFLLLLKLPKTNSNVSNVPEESEKFGRGTVEAWWLVAEEMQQ